MGEQDPGEVEVIEEEPYDFWTVNRQGGDVWLNLTRTDGSGYALWFDPESATTVGLALAQAGQNPEETT